MYRIGRNRNVGCPGTQEFGGAAVSVAMTMMSLQAAKTAMANPVESLR